MDAERGGAAPAELGRGASRLLRTHGALVWNFMTWFFSGIERNLERLTSETA